MKKYLLWISVFVAIVAALIAAVFMHRHSIAVLNPHGSIGHKERNLMLFASMLGLFVVIPVFIMTFTIVWRYREGNKTAKYRPDFEADNRFEALWWGFPCLIILILSVVTWNSSHELDPYRPLVSKNPPITIQAVALQWKWLFIYPEQHIATVNYLKIPVDTPVNFQITADAPMNSLWIPRLGGQVYAMAGMKTQLHLIADQMGNFEGVSANLSGRGFADMHFITQSVTNADFNNWVKLAKGSPNHLTTTAYNQLSKPGTMHPATYAASQAGLYDTIMMKYMGPNNTAMQNMSMNTSTL